MAVTSSEVGTLVLTGLDFEYLPPCEAEWCKQFNVCPGPADYIARFPCGCTWLTCAPYVDIWRDDIRGAGSEPVRCPKCMSQMTVSDIAGKTTWSLIR